MTVERRAERQINRRSDFIQNKITSSVYLSLCVSSKLRFLSIIKL